MAFWLFNECSSNVACTWKFHTSFDMNVTTKKGNICFNKMWPFKLSTNIKGEPSTIYGNVKIFLVILLIFFSPVFAVVFYFLSVRPRCTTCVYIKKKSLKCVTNPEKSDFQWRNFRNNNLSTFVFFISLFYSKLDWMSKQTVSH